MKLGETLNNHKGKIVVGMVTLLGGMDVMILKNVVDATKSVRANCAKQWFIEEEFKKDPSIVQIIQNSKDGVHIMFGDVLQKNETKEDGTQYCDTENLKDGNETCYVIPGEAWVGKALAEGDNNISRVIEKNTYHKLFTLALDNGEAITFRDSSAHQ